MKPTVHLSFITLMLMISFASVNAVLFSPGLPEIANFFSISESSAQETITWFLVGYALGQLLYGPISNRFGRKPALYAGIGLQIFSSLLCIFAGLVHVYFILVLGRFLMALGAGVGLKMTFTLISETHEPAEASRKLSHLMIAFAITPSLAVTLGGILTQHFGWQSPFYAGIFYALILLVLSTRLPETKKKLELNALKLNHLFQAYASQFKNFGLVSGGLLMGSATAFVYIFAALAPFVAISLLHMSSTDYGLANLLPSIGLILGSLFSGRLVRTHELGFILRTGILITIAGALIMLIFALLKMPALLILFIPMTICYFGLSLIFANASSLAMSKTDDKAHGSAVMNFINMGLTTLLVLSLGLFSLQTLLMPIVYLVLTALMFGFYKLARS